MDFENGMTLETEGTPAEVDYYDGWDDDDAIDDADEEADQQEAPAGEVETPPAEEEPKAEEPAPESAEPEPPEVVDDFEQIKVLGETRRVSREEARAYIQKGADYDRIRGKYDELREKARANEPRLQFLDDLARMNGVSVEELMESTRAAALAKKEGIDEKTALERVRLEQRAKELDERERSLAEPKKQAPAEPKKPDPLAEAAERRKRDIADFLAAYPKADTSALPKSVWDEVAAGKPLLVAYANYERDKAMQELENLKKSAENRQKAPPSRESAGAGKNTDPYFEGWDDDDDW